MASNTPFPEFKTTGDDKHDLETYIEDLTDYCIMQNWLDPSKEIYNRKFWGKKSLLTRKRDRRRPAHAVLLPVFTLQLHTFRVKTARVREINAKTKNTNYFAV